MRIEPSVRVLQLLEESGVAERIRKALDEQERVDCLNRILDLEELAVEPIFALGKYGFELKPTSVYCTKGLDDLLRRAWSIKFRSSRRGANRDGTEEGNYLLRVLGTTLVQEVFLGAESFKVPEKLTIPEDLAEDFKAGGNRSDALVNCWFNVALSYILSAHFERTHPGEYWREGKVKYAVIPNGTRVQIDRLDISHKGIWTNLDSGPCTRFSEGEFAIVTYDEKMTHRKEVKYGGRVIYREGEESISKGPMRSLELPKSADMEDTLTSGLEAFKRMAGYDFLEVGEDDGGLKKRLCSLPKHP